MFKVGDCVEDLEVPGHQGYVRQLLPDEMVKVWWCQGHFHSVVHQSRIRVLPKQEQSRC